MNTSTTDSYTAKLIDGPLEGKTVATAFLESGDPRPRLELGTDPGKHYVYARGAGLEFEGDRRFPTHRGGVPVHQNRLRLISPGPPGRSGTCRRLEHESEARRRDPHRDATGASMRQKVDGDPVAGGQLAGELRTVRRRRPPSSRRLRRGRRHPPRSPASWEATKTPSTGTTAIATAATAPTMARATTDAAPDYVEHGGRTLPASARGAAMAEERASLHRPPGDGAGLRPQLDRGEQPGARRA